MAPVHVTISLCISYIPILWFIGWYCSIKFNQILSETNIDLDRSCLGLLTGSCEIRACLLQIVMLIFKYPLLNFISNFTLAFISFRGCLYSQNEPVPLGAMLTNGAVRDILPPVARALALHKFKMASHFKTRSNTSCYIYIVFDYTNSNVLITKRTNS